MNPEDFNLEQPQNPQCAECGNFHAPAAPHISCNDCGHVHPATLPLMNSYTWSHQEDRRVARNHIACPTCGGYHQPPPGFNANHRGCSTCGEPHPLGTGHPTEDRYCPHCDDYVAHGGDGVAQEEWHRDDDHDYDWDHEEPRDEHELVAQEPERVAGINKRLKSVVEMHDKRVHDSHYFVRSIPAGTYPNQYDHVVLAYHKNDPETAIGHLSYNDRGEVGGMFLDRNHVKSLAATQMLVAAHRHLKNTVGQPIGLLRSDQTTIDSANLIKKIDPDSTYLRSENANSGRNPAAVQFTGMFGAVPISADSLRPSNADLDRIKNSGYTVNDALAMSYDSENRHQVSGMIRRRPNDFDPKVVSTHHRLNKAVDAYMKFNNKQEDNERVQGGLEEAAKRVHLIPGDAPAHEEVGEISGLGLRPRGYENVQDRIWQKDANRKSAINGVLRHPEADLVGTAGVWTGDEDIEDEKSPSRAETEERHEGRVPLDLNPLERVRLLTSKPWQEPQYRRVSE